MEEPAQLEATTVMVYWVLYGTLEMTMLVVEAVWNGIVGVMEVL